MADERRNGSSYRAARQTSAFLLIGVVVVIVLADSFGIGRQVEPLILVPLLLTAGGLLAVDLRSLGR